MSKHWIGLSVAALLFTTTPAIAFADEAAPVHEAESGPNGMQVAGGVLIGVGGVSFVTGGIITLVTLNSSFTTLPDITGLFVGLPLVAGGLLLNGIGIPLYIVGSKKKKTSAFSTPPPPPVTVSGGIGFGSASLKVTF